MFHSFCHYFVSSYQRFDFSSIIPVVPFSFLSSTFSSFCYFIDTTIKLRDPVACASLNFVSFYIFSVHAMRSTLLYSHTPIASSFCFSVCFEIIQVSHPYINMGSLGIQGGAVAQSIERATPGEEVLGSIPAVAACFKLVESHLV